MYALLTETNEFSVGGDPVAIFRYPQAMTYYDNGEAYQAPANWWHLWSEAEKNAKHIFVLVPTNYDSKTERLSGDPTYSFDGSVVSETYTVVPMDLDQYKRNRLRMLKGERNTAAAVDITVNVNSTDYTFVAETFERTLIGRTVTALSAGMTFPANYKWATKDNQLLTLTEAQTKQLARLMLEQEYLAQRQYWELAEQIEAATSIAEVDVVVWT